MLETIPLIKSLTTPVAKTVSWIYSKFKRPSIELKKAPENIFQHIKPGVDFDRVKEILGAPHRKIHDEYLYSFKDLKVQITVEPDNQISSVCAALSEVSRRTRFKIHRGYK